MMSDTRPDLDPAPGGQEQAEELSGLKERIVGLESEVKDLRQLLSDIREVVNRYGPEALIAPGDEEALLARVSDLAQKVSAIDETVVRQVTPLLKPGE